MNFLTSEQVIQNTCDSIIGDFWLFFDLIIYLLGAVWGTNNKNQLSDFTTCMTTLQGENNEYMHYDVHSLYGFSETKATVK